MISERNFHPEAAITRSKGIEQEEIMDAVITRISFTSPIDAANEICLGQTDGREVPAGQATPPSQTTPVQQTGGEDRAKIKQDIKELQEDLAKLSVEMDSLKRRLEHLNKAIADYQKDINSMGSVFSETYRGERLDRLAEMMATRKDLRQQLEDDASLMQAIKDGIDDLLNKLANPTNTEPTKQEPPKENKQIGMGTPTRLL
jgi:predicted RNase H-like nuclease (RuvC/YqgF family)